MQQAGRYQSFNRGTKYKLKIIAMVIKVNVVHEIGDIVYLRTEKEDERVARMVKGYAVRSNTVYYELSYSDLETTFHEDFEIVTSVFAPLN